MTFESIGEAWLMELVVRSTKTRSTTTIVTTTTQKLKLNEGKLTLMTKKRWKTLFRTMRESKGQVNSMGPVDSSKPSPQLGPAIKLQQGIYLLDPEINDQR